MRSVAALPAPEKRDLMERVRQGDLSASTYGIVEYRLSEFSPRTHDPSLLVAIGLLALMERKVMLAGSVFSLVIMTTDIPIAHEGLVIAKDMGFWGPATSRHDEGSDRR